MLSKVDVAEAYVTEEQKNRLQEFCLDRIYGHQDSPLSEYKWTMDQIASADAKDVTNEGKDLTGSESISELVESNNLLNC